jgi:ADP-ribose pyrophosphatase YjhB (NUDIX family)
MSFLDKIRDRAMAGWRVVLNGQVVENVEHIEISNPNFWALEFGFKTYNRLALTEKSFGGSVVVPYSTAPKNQVLVGLVYENRDNMGGWVWCGPGGFSDNNETHKQTAAREFREETGMMQASGLKDLPGLPVNSNRALFVASPELGQGVHNYTLRVPFDFLLPEDGNVFKLKDEKLLGDFKKANLLRFMPIDTAILRSGDALALSALAQLAVYLGFFKS